MRSFILSILLSLSLLATATAVSRTDAAADAQDAAAARFDAGVGGDSGDAGVVSSSPTAHPDPAEDPGGAWDAVSNVRKHGGFWLAVGLAVVLIGAAIRKRLEPAPGEPEPDPDSWRARSLATVGASIILGATAIDKLQGVIGWGAAATALVGAGALAWRAIDPPKGSARKVET